MRYYKDHNNTVYAYDDGRSTPKGTQELTTEEINVLFHPPTLEPTLGEQITALEASITPRNLRGAALGDQFAIDKIQAVEDKIKALRE